MTRIESIIALLKANTGKPVSVTDIAAYASYVDSVTLETISSSIMETSPIYKAGLEGSPEFDAVKQMFKSLFGYTDAEIDALKATEAGAAGFQYWVDELLNNPTMININTLAIALLNGAAAVDQAKASALVATELAAYEASIDNGGEPAVEGDNYDLTVSVDKGAAYVGTDGNDTFTANVEQNQNGALANTLSTGDTLDGGKGYDVVNAKLINDNQVDDGNFVAVTPILKNIEEVRIDAKDGVEDVVFFDADDTAGVQHWASEDSRADLTIVNANTTATQITKDIVIEMKDTIQNSDLAVYFNEYDLKAAPDEEEGTASFYIQVADGNAQDTTKPLANIKFDLEFTQDGTTYTFEDLTSIDGTYVGLKLALETAFANEGLTSYTVSLGDTFTTFETFNLDYIANYVTVTDDSKTEFDSVKFTPSQLSGTTKAIILADSQKYSESSTSSFQVESTIILDGVGRTSNGGELIVGSTSASENSTGIEVFNIEVRDSSVVHDISTTNDDGRTSWSGLQTINLTNGTGYSGDFVLTNNATYEATDDGIFDNVYNSTFKDSLNLMTATDFSGDIFLGTNKVGGTTGANDIMNLGTLDADNNVTGNVTLNALNNDGLAHTVATGSGDDVLNITLDKDSDVSISIVAGDNTVTVDETNPTVGIGSTATITTGAGVDTIYGNDVAITVEAGAGNDVIYAENTGTGSVQNIDTEIGSIKDNALDKTNTNNVNAVEFLYGRQVLVTISTDGAAADKFVNGFESILVDVTPAAGKYLTTQADLNAAIVKAINNDANLSKIAEAKIAADGTVNVTYLVDGVQVDDAVEVSFYGDDFNQLSNAAQNAMLTEYKALWNDSTITLANLETAYNAAFGNDDGTEMIDSTAKVAGTDSTNADNVNTVNGQEGNDVIVLSSNTNSKDVVVFTGYNQGHDTVVHFETGKDSFDFSSYLTGTIMNPDVLNGTSTSAESEMDLAISATVNEVFTANSVNLLDFSDLGVTAGVTFETMTIAQITAALNAAGNGTSIAEESTKTLYQTTGKSVLLVSNDEATGNDGEYKIYELTYTDANVADTAAKNFTVKEIGQVDVGDATIAVADIA